MLAQAGDRFSSLGAGLVAAFKVATPYSLHVCPEGQNVTLTCRILGPVAKGHDVTFYKTWYRSSRGEVQACSDRRPIRNVTFQDLHLHHGSHQAANTSQDLARHHGLESVSDHHGNFSITILNLTALDSGLYCCLVVELRHLHSEQRVHGAMELEVQSGEDLYRGQPGGAVPEGWCVVPSGRGKQREGQRGGVGCVYDGVLGCDPVLLRVMLYGWQWHSRGVCVRRGGRGVWSRKSLWSAGCDGEGRSTWLCL